MDGDERLRTHKTWRPGRCLGFDEDVLEAGGSEPRNRREEMASQVPKT